MGTSDLINLIAAILVGGGTITLAIMTWKSNRLISKQYKNRQLDDIILWATEVIDWDIDQSYEAKKELKEAEEPLWVILGQLLRLRDGFHEIKRKGELIIRPLILTSKSKPLTNAIDRLLEDLQKQIELGGLQEIAIMKDISTKSKTLSDEFNSAQDEVVRHKKRLDGSAEKVICEATKIKAKGEDSKVQEVRQMTEIDIGKELLEIKQQLTRIDKRGKFQWEYNIGFAGIIASVGILAFNTWASLTVLILGLFLMIYALFRKRA